jgi:hypothetical protein
LTFPDVLLLLVTLTSAFNMGLQYYTTVSTYPLFSALSDETFVPYHKAYEHRLPLAIYAPYALLMLGTLLLLFVHPARVSPLWVVLALLLNGAIMAVSLVFAAPVHARLDQHGKRDDLLALLRRYNLLRLLASAASTTIFVLLALRSLVA